MFALCQAHNHTQSSLQQNLQPKVRRKTEPSQPTTRQQHPPLQPSYNHLPRTPTTHAPRSFPPLRTSQALGLCARTTSEIPGIQQIHHQDVPGVSPFVSRQLDGFPQSPRGVPAAVSAELLAVCGRLPSRHIPHSLIANRVPKLKGKHPPLVRSQPCSKPDLTAFWLKEGERGHPEQSAELRTTKKKEKWELGRSEETVSNSRSQFQQSPAGLFGLDFLTPRQVVFLNPEPHAPEGLLEYSQTPTMKRRKLSQARSILSREPSVGFFESFQFDQSILVEREIDVFSNICPLTDIPHCEMSTALDQSRANQPVTLKFFRDNQHYLRELQMIRRAEEVARTQGGLRVLRFDHSLMQDSFHGKKIIFVYETCTCSLARHIRQVGEAGQQVRAAFCLEFLQELKTMLGVLAEGGVVLGEVLVLEDFVWTDRGWCLHNLSRFRLCCVRSEWEQEKLLAVLRVSLGREGAPQQ